MGRLDDHPRHGTDKGAARAQPHRMGPRRGSHTRSRTGDIPPRLQRRLLSVGRQRHKRERSGGQHRRQRQPRGCHHLRSETRHPRGVAQQGGADRRGSRGARPQRGGPDQHDALCRPAHAMQGRRHMPRLQVARLYMQLHTPHAQLPPRRQTHRRARGRRTGILRKQQSV